ncbi:hypothetical protein BDW74DRAFT_184086 [Aspergillus multicolor]|uniref:uncharacterized protein n=1 Tax=Aspergillus multicolor TaxID=41759 RepID=UPI003CCDCA5C
MRVITFSLRLQDRKPSAEKAAEEKAAAGNAGLLRTIQAVGRRKKSIDLISGVAWYLAHKKLPYYTVQAAYNVAAATWQLFVFYGGPATTLAERQEIETTLLCDTVRVWPNETHDATNLEDVERVKNAFRAWDGPGWKSMTKYEVCRGKIFVTEVDGCQLVEERAAFKRVLQGLPVERKEHTLETALELLRARSVVANVDWEAMPEAEFL